jgi:hypothetical protein
MKKIVILIILLVAFFVTGYSNSKSGPDWKKLSPFTAVSFEGETVSVEYEVTDCELASIEGITSSALVKVAKKRF